MKVVLVSAGTYPLALGIRYVSAFLKRIGHSVSCLYMSHRGRPDAALPPALLSDFIEHCRGADVVGIGLMTNSFYRACELTDALRKAGTQSVIVWGGTHATVAPRECTDHADYVCVGEGEKAMVVFLDALAAGRDPGLTPGFARLRHGQLEQNPLYPLADDLDSYPFPDYALDGHWVVEHERLVPARPELLRGVLRCYRMLSTRGCPFSCSFCNNATQLHLYRDEGHGRHWVRKRSVETIIAEIEQIRSLYPSVSAVNLVDDLFLIRTEAELEAFVSAYGERVNLPIELDAFPNTVTEAKIRLLSRLPIQLISMGIQSGCQETLLSLYNRPTRVERVADAIRIISSHGLRAEYHYLVCNPFESDASLLQTLRFAASFHRGPAKLRLFPLQFYPGSALCARARGEGVIGEHHETAYHGVYAAREQIAKARYLEIWLRIVLALRGVGVPAGAVHRLVDVVTHPWTRRILDRSWFAPLSFVLYRVGRGLHNVTLRPILQPLSKWRLRRRQRARQVAAGVSAHAEMHKAA